MEDFLSMQSNEDIPSSGNPELDAKTKKYQNCQKRATNTSKTMIYAWQKSHSKEF